MPTVKKRINISLPEQIEVLLEKISKRDNVPLATKALELITKALVIEEDAALESLAASRDNKSTKFVSHEDAWL